MSAGLGARLACRCQLGGSALFIGYLVGAAAMVAGGLVEVALGVPAEQKSL